MVFILVYCSAHAQCLIGLTFRIILSLRISCTFSLPQLSDISVYRYNMDPSWSETGDRYLIKLFRDYLFHQVTETGEPWLDMAHIVSSLNKVRILDKCTKLEALPWDTKSPSRPAKLCLLKQKNDQKINFSFRCYSLHLTVATLLTFFEIH